jgi:hypothetical protein
VDESARGEQVEDLFRALNERIRELARSWSLAELELVCECGDAGCFAVLTVGEEEYEAATAEPSRFLVVPGHEQPLDEVVERSERYVVVRRRALPTTAGSSAPLSEAS